MSLSTAKILQSLIPAAAYGLNIICPCVPAFIWNALITAVLNGNVTVDHIQQFLDDHNIQAMPDYDIKKNEPFG